MGNCRTEVDEKPVSPGGTGEPQKVPEQGEVLAQILDMLTTLGAFVEEYPQTLNEPSLWCGVDLGSNPGCVT